jgi:hypothetical protein
MSSDLLSGYLQNQIRLLALEIVNLYPQFPIKIGFKLTVHFLNFSFANLLNLVLCIALCCLFQSITNSNYSFVSLYLPLKYEYS